MVANLLRNNLIYTVFFGGKKQDRVLKHRKGSYLARRRDIYEGGVLVVVVLIRGGVGSLGRGQRLGDAYKEF